MSEGFETVSSYSINDCFLFLDTCQSLPQGRVKGGRAGPVRDLIQLNLVWELVLRWLKATGVSVCGGRRKMGEMIKCIRYYYISVMGLHRLSQ